MPRKNDRARWSASAAIDRACRTQERAVTALADSYMQAWLCKSTWKDLTDRNRAITQSPDVLRCPPRVRRYIRDYNDYLRNFVFASFLPRTEVDPYASEE